MSRPVCAVGWIWILNVARICTHGHGDLVGHNLKHSQADQRPAVGGCKTAAGYLRRVADPME